MKAKSAVNRMKKLVKGVTWKSRFRFQYTCWPTIHMNQNSTPNQDTKNK